MTRSLLLLVNVLALLLHTRVVRAQTLVPGGGPPKSDCYGEWLSPAPNRGTTGIDCQDGDPACDLDRIVNGACAVAVGVCLHQSNLARCTPGSVQRVTVQRQAEAPPEGPSDPPPAAAAGTGDGRRPAAATPSSPFPLKVTRTGRQQALQAGHVPPGHDRAREAAHGRRPAPPALRPERRRGPLRRESQRRPCRASSGHRRGAAPTSTWAGTGNAQNLAVVANAVLRVCLTGCGATTTPQCTARPAETSAVNGTTFGAPLPLLAADVPVCVVNRFGTPPIADLAADVASGARRRHAQPGIGGLPHQPDAGVSALLRVRPRGRRDL